MDPFSTQTVRELLDGYPLTNLDAGTPRDAVHAKLKSLTVESLFDPRAVKDREVAACCVSGLWLWHNYLDESHKISQEIETSAGSAWHGIMHRREGDFWNANYWFARVNDEALFSGVAEEFTHLGFDVAALPPRLSKLVQARKWSASDFTNEVQAVLKVNRTDEVDAALRLATAEWRCLFRGCWGAAIR